MLGGEGSGRDLGARVVARLPEISTVLRGVNGAESKMRTTRRAAGVNDTLPPRLHVGVAGRTPSACWNASAVTPAGGLNVSEVWMGRV